MPEEMTQIVRCLDDGALGRELQLQHEGRPDDEREIVGGQRCVAEEFGQRNEEDAADATEPTPITVARAAICTECRKSKDGGLTDPTADARSPPASPARPAEVPNAISFHAVTSMPMVAAAISEERIAPRTRPVLPRRRFHTRNEAAVKTPSVNT